MRVDIMAKDKENKGATEGDTTNSDGVNAAGQEILRRINAKDVVGGNIRDLVMEGKIKLPCDAFTLIGRAGNLRDGESSFGPWTALVGEFEAVNILEGSENKGKAFIAPQMFLPGPAGDLLVTQVRKFVQEEIPVTSEQYKKTGKTYKVSGEYVDLAVIVGLKKASRDGGAPYEFTVRPIVPVQKSDALSGLRERMAAALPQLLSAPKA
jgi:hypothetical protein